MTSRGILMFLLVHMVAQGETCFFTEETGQKGSESLRSVSGNTIPDVSACKTHCNTTELCIAGEFLSTTNTCYIYLLETSLTVQPDTVFFRWDCSQLNNEASPKGLSDGAKAAIVIASVAAVGGLVAGGVAVYKHYKKKTQTIPEKEHQETTTNQEETSLTDNRH